MCRGLQRQGAATSGCGDGTCIPSPPDVQFDGEQGKQSDKLHAVMSASFLFLHANAAM